MAGLIRRTSVRAGCTALVASAVLAGCVPSRPSAAPSTRTEIETITRTASTSPLPTFTPPPARSVPGLPPGQRPPAGQVEKACPYLPSSPRYYGDPRPNVASIVGSHVLRTTVLTSTSPVGCRFYFYAGPFQAIADVVPRRFASARAAYAAMIATSEAGSDASGHAGLVPGVDAVLYRTRFFGPDGSRDWACVFAAGRVMVVVHTQRDDTSFSALQLARAFAPKFAAS
jgi:hypothetical protein